MTYFFVLGAHAASLEQFERLYVQVYTDCAKCYMQDHGDQ